VAYRHAQHSTLRDHLTTMTDGRTYFLVAKCRVWLRCAAKQFI